MRIMLLWILAILAPSLASAQAFTRPHAETASDSQPVRDVPIVSYTLALIWEPEYCHVLQHSGVPECTDPASRSSFALHGLWPDGEGAHNWPQYCHPVPVLTDDQIRAALPMTHSVQLLQHEWAKHGACMYRDPMRYFADEKRLFDAIRTPDMRALAARRGMTVADVTASFAAANPGMRPDMIRLNLNRSGWLEEVWICLGLDKKPRTCPATAGGAVPTDAVKVQAPS